MNNKITIKSGTKNTFENTPLVYLVGVRTNVVWHIIIIIILPLVVYFKVIYFEFSTMDDPVIILGNYNIIGDINKIDKAFKSDAFLSKSGDSFYRPIQTVSFMLDATISGKNPWMYHLSNLIIHIATCISLYFFLRFLKFQNLTAFFVSLIFSVHPLLTDAVAGISSRGDLLIGLFGILLFISFGKYLKTGKYIYIFLHIVLFLLIVFTKETSILFPFFLLFYYFFILRVFPKSTDPKGQSIPKEKIILPFFISWILIYLIYFTIRTIVINNKISGNIFGIIPFFKNLQTIPITLGKSILPFNLSTMPLFDTISTINGIVFLIVLIILITSIVKDKQKYSSEKKWILIMGFFWFIFFTIPSMLYRIELAEYTISYYEHRIYLPMIGLFIMLGFYFDNLLKQYNTKYIAYVSIFILAVFTYITFRYADDYKDYFSFLSSAIKANSNNAGAYYNRGIEYMKKQDYQSSISDFTNAIEICNFPKSYYNRACVEIQTQDYPSAERDFTKAILSDSTNANIYINRSGARLNLNNYDGAIQDLNKAEKLDPSNANIYFNRGNILLSYTKYQEAIQDFSKAISLNPSFLQAYINRGCARIRLNDYNGTIEDCGKALQIDPNSFFALTNLGVTFRELGKLDEAISYFNSAINLSNNYFPAFYERGITKQRKNDIEGACNDWNEALKLGYTQAKEMLDKYCK